jgi:acyl carrier protein
MFGITETTVHVTYRPLTAADLELASSSVIGRPLECLQVYLLDERGQPVPIGVAAEVCVGGTGLARGYLNRAELTAERFVPNPFSKSPGARLYRSGDLARFLPNGDIEYLGRIDQQVKVRGFRIELGEIEAALAQHEVVRECTVVASADGNGETKLLAYLVAQQQQPAPSVTALREFLKEKLPEYMVPASFTMLDAMPLTANGKIDRKALPAPGQDRSTLFGDYVAPRSAVEQVLARIWAELLQVERVGLNDNFFDLGGHSLLATRLVARLRSVLSIELPLRAVFEAPTLVDLSETVLQQPGQRARIAKTAEVLLELERLSEGEAGQMLEEVIVSTSEREAR